MFRFSQTHPQIWKESDSLGGRRLLVLFYIDKVILGVRGFGTCITQIQMDFEIFCFKTYFEKNKHFFLMNDSKKLMIKLQHLSTKTKTRKRRDFPQESRGLPVSIQIKRTSNVHSREIKQ